MGGMVINLHGHSEYSSLDGFCKVSEIPLRAKELNQSAIALTDHGNLNGIYKFYKACKKNDIKPILGEEFYLCDDVSKKNFIYHITLLAKNYDGWKNLLSLHKISFQNIYYKPRIDLKSLKEHSQGLICLSGCLRGMLPQAILKSSIPEESLGYFTSVFKDDFYVEIMNHGLKDQQRVNSVLRELCDKYKLKKVVTNDYHYLRQEDHELQDILLCDQIKSTLDDPKRLKLSTPEFYIKSQEDLINIEQDEIDNTELIAGQCKVTLKKHDFLIPESEDAQDIFVSQITQGIKDRFGELPENYTQRLRTEYEVITKANLIPYFLIVSDYVNWAKSKGILVGTGRGSVGGCLIAYLLNIHDLDPIKHNLLFSRFYNPGRKNSLPDIDVDFPLKHIDSIINYLISKYGKDNVANIGTYTSLDIKGAIKLLCRTMGIDFETSNKFSKYLDSPEETKLECAKNSLFKDLYEKAQSFLNLIMYSSIHAAGIVISSKSLDSMIPIRFVGDRQVSSWAMDDIEEIGLVKYDILHLNTLDIIEDVLLSQGLKIKDIPLDDKQTFDLINYTNNVGIFQLSSMGISSLANQMKVESIDDISLVVALYRPGPISSNFHNIYINRKFNREPVTYLHPKLEPILKSTLGVLIYQEQIIAICQQLGGFSEIEADSVRKAMGKKIPELMKKYEKLFIEGCDKNQIDKGIAQKIWSQMDEFAGYGFNLSHSTAYAYITYYTSYLKSHYPVEFMTSLLNNNFGNQEKLSLYLKECKRLKIEVIPPSVNGNCDFSIKDDKIIFGLKGVKGMGEKTGLEIVKQKYSTFTEFCIKVRPSSDIIVTLAEAGAFDEFDLNRNLFIDSALDISQQIKNIPKESIKVRTLFKIEHKIILKDKDELDFYDLAEREYNRLGVYLRYNPLETKDISDFTPERLSNYIAIGGFLHTIEEKITKKGQKMGIGKFMTELGEMEVIFFPKTYLEKRNLIRPNNFLNLQGKYDINNCKLCVEKIGQIL